MAATLHEFPSLLRTPPQAATAVQLLDLARDAAGGMRVAHDKLEALPPDRRSALVESAARQVVERLIRERKVKCSTEERNEAVQEAVDELIGFGPIGALLREDDVDEIMVNGPREIWVERKGKVTKTHRTFRDDAHVLQIIDRIVTPLGRVIDAKRPLCDARLPDGSRVNCVIPPLAIDGPSITIRKFKKDRLTIDDLVRFGTVTQPMADFLAACVKGRLNVVISGGTGSGKTTTLNILSNFIPNGERIVTVEDAAELQLQQDHVVRLETRPPDLDGTGAITIRDLVRNTLRMRPERIVVGEIRGGEAFDMLQAMNTGHDGSLTTGHANSPRHMIRRIESMCMMAGLDIPMAAIREQIATAVHLIVQQSRLHDGTRRITHITEVQGMESGVVTLSDIFVFRPKGVDENGKVLGSLEPTGIRPQFEEHLRHHAVTLPREMFQNG